MGRPPKGPETALPRFNFSRSVKAGDARRRAGGGEIRAAPEAGGRRGIQRRRKAPGTARKARRRTARKAVMRAEVSQATQAPGPG